MVNKSKKFPKARILIATQQVQDVVDQLSELGYHEFYSALDLTQNYNVNNYTDYYSH